MNQPRHPMADTCVMVFARAPLPGHCKTRLIPALGEQGAARLHEQLVRRVLAEACRTAPAALQLWCTPDITDPFFAACAHDYPIVLRCQGDGDLGERMARAIEHALRAHERAIIIGADVPELDSAYLLGAASALERAVAVFGPAEDGGYVLVGLSQTVPQVFADIEWGGPQVMAQTRARLHSLGMPAVELATLWDLDRPEDLARLQA